MPVDLDAAIDTVARQLTEGEPSGALRARVLDEIAQDRRHALVVPRWAWAGAAAAVLLAVATSVWLVRPTPLPGEAAATVARQRAAAPVVADEGTGAQATAAGLGQASPAASSPAAARRNRAAAVREARAAEDEGGGDFHAVPALAEIEPLRLMAVEPDALQVARLEVAPLTAMTSIDIRSLESGSNDSPSADPKKENRP